jgi:hypothetical protein
MASVASAWRLAGADIVGRMHELLEEIGPPGKRSEATGDGADSEAIRLAFKEAEAMAEMAASFVERSESIVKRRKSRA